MDRREEMRLLEATEGGRGTGYVAVMKGVTEHPWAQEAF